jgi:hypothetical protein
MPKILAQTMPEFQSDAIIGLSHDGEEDRTGQLEAEEPEICGQLSHRHRSIIHALSFLSPPWEAFGGYTHTTFSAVACRGMNKLSHATSAIRSDDRVSRVFNSSIN